MDDTYYYDEDDDQESNEERLLELSTLPFNEALASASELLGKEDTRLPAAFALLGRLKSPAEGQEEADAKERRQEVSCWIPSPWSRRVPGAGFIAKEKWQYDEERRRQEAVKAPAKVERPVSRRRQLSEQG